MPASLATSSVTPYADFYRRSIDEREAFWAEQAQLIDWQQPYEQVCDARNPAFADRKSVV